MKHAALMLTFFLLAFVIQNCDKSTTDEEGKEVCLDEYIAKEAGKDRATIEAEAKSRGIEASELIIEISKSATGAADAIFDCSASENYAKLCVQTSGKFVKAGSTDEMTQAIQNYLSAQPQDSIDIAFLIDGTGSMMDDIGAVKNKLSSIISAMHGKAINISMAVYRDKNVDSNWYQRNQNNFVRSDNTEPSTFLSKIVAEGGGDFPESLFDASYKTISELPWTSKGRALVVITDAPALTGSKTQYSLTDAIDLCIDQKVVPLVILVGIK